MTDTVGINVGSYLSDVLSRLAAELEPIFYTSKKKNGVGGYAMCKANHYQFKEALGGCKQQKNLRKTDPGAALLKIGVKVLGDSTHLAEMIIASISRQRSVIKPLAGVGSQSSLIAGLERRDSKLLPSFEGDALTINELRDRRADILRQIDQLREAGSKPEERPNNGIPDAARLTVKSGLRFGQIKDAGEPKRALTQTSSKVIVRDASLIAFEFKDSVLPPGSPLIRQQILLDQPIVIVPPAEELPVGCRRCIKCGEIKQVENDFYPRLNSCKACLRKQARHRYLTVRKVKAKRERE